MNKKATLVAGMVASLLSAGSMACATDGAKEAKGSVKCVGGNACKGQSACHGKNNACAGQNACGGQGWVMTTTDDCTAKKGTVEKE